jgi:hypothetical protein
VRRLDAGHMLGAVVAVEEILAEMGVGTGAPALAAE